MRELDNLAKWRVSAKSRTKGKKPIGKRKCIKKHSALLLGRYSAPHCQEEEEEEEETLLIYTAQGSPFRRKKSCLLSMGALGNNAQKPH